MRMPIRKSFSVRSARGRLLAAAVVAGLPLALLAAPGTADATQVAAQPCSGTGCDGLDPTLSYDPGSAALCVNGAYTAAQWNTLGGTLELIWGPNCQTNWVRFTPTDNDVYGIAVIGFDANGNETDIVGDGIENTFFFQGQGYSDQVWSPGPADACVEDYTFKTGLICYDQPAAASAARAGHARQRSAG